MSPDNEDPAGQDDQDELVIPHVPTSPELPPPPDIQFKRPELGKPHGASDSGKSPGSSNRGSLSRDERGNRPVSGASMSAGISFAASVIVGVLIGQFVDRKMGFANGGTPWGTIAFTLLGMAAGFVNLFRLLSIYDKRDRR
jgi:F0F1-type ATP synthase assembly protein I